MSNSKLSLFFTTGQAAELLGVSLRTVQLWAEMGLLRGWKTEGGHRRIARQSIQEMLDGRFPSGTQDFAEQRTARTSLKVLIADHDQEALHTYRTLLPTLNSAFELTTASRSEETLLKLGQDTPDVLVADLQTLGQDNGNLIRFIAEQDSSSELQIVIATNFSETQLRNFRLPSAITVIPKPASLLQLGALLNKFYVQRIGRQRTSTTGRS